MKRLLFILFTILVALGMTAQTLTVQAPRQVVEGQQFRLTFVLDTQELDDFEFPTVNGLDVLYGPATSRQSSVQIINGRSTSQSSLSLTYTVRAQKAGSITIPSATAKVGDKAVRSRQTTIEVLPPDKTQPGNNGGGQSRGGQNNTPRTQRVGEAISAQDLFMAVTASKTKVYEQEALLLTYKLYSLVNLTSLTGEMPDISGCHTQEIDLPQQKSFKMEHYNGRNYNTVVWRQYVVFPQQPGTLKIPSVKFEGVVVQQSVSMDPFDAFFGGGHLMQEVQKTIVAPALDITVEALPTPKPDNFCGAVGQFKVSSDIDVQQLKANEALTLKLTVSGTGNMKLIMTPEVVFPKDFDTYDAKVTDHWRIGREGASGSKVFEYLAVPRHQGEYDIEPVEFCYFDTGKGTYQTLTADSYHISVAKGEGAAAGAATVKQEEIERLADDIHFIKRGATHPVPADGGWWNSVEYWLAYLGALVAFLVVVAVFNKQRKANADIARRRGRQAGKVAARRLKKAAKLLKAHDQAAFYEELMRALWGIVGDRLNIPVAELTKENVGEKLAARGVEAETIEQFNRVLGDCEFARYAPGDADENMNKLYAEAAEVINKL